MRKITVFITQANGTWVGYIFVTADILLSLLLTSLLLLDLALCMWLGLQKNKIPPPFKHHKQNWTVEDWKNVAWSDESRFLLRHSDGRVRIWCKNGVEDVFLAHFRPLRANAMAYLSIISDHVHPFMATMYPSTDGYFQQDNAPCHKA